MDDSPLVSVVVIFLDEERFLREAIESVLAQSYARWELVLVDDGSTDSSTEIARSYAESFPDRVVYLEHERHENRGASASRNAGIRGSRGELIALLDADDTWVPHKLETQVEMLRREPRAGMVSGASLYWRSWEGGEAESADQATADRVVPVGGPQDALVRPPALLIHLYPLGEGAAPCPSDLLFRREILERTGLFEEDFRGAHQLYEDQVFLCKVYAHVPIFVSSQCLSRYRVHADSCVANTRDRYDEVREAFLLWFEGYVERDGVTDPGVLRALHGALALYHHPVFRHLRRRWPRVATRLDRLARRWVSRRSLAS